MILSQSCKLAVSMGYSARFDRLLVSDLIASYFQYSFLFSCLFLTCNTTDTHLLVSSKVNLGVDWFGRTFVVLLVRMNK